MSRPSRLLRAAVQSVAGVRLGGCSLDPAFACPTRWFASKHGGRKHKNVSQLLTAQQQRRSPATAPIQPVSPSPLATITPPANAAQPPSSLAPAQATQLPPAPKPFDPHESNTTPSSAPSSASTTSSSALPSFQEPSSTTPASVAPSAASTNPIEAWFRFSAKAELPFPAPSSTPYSDSSTDPFDSSQSAASKPSATELMSRLTQSEGDRQLLRRTGQIFAVCLVVSLVVNGLVVAGKWHDMWALLRPAPAAITAAASAEEAEEEQLAEQLYSEHRLWLQQRERVEAAVRLAEQQRQQTLAEQLQQLQTEQLAHSATAELTQPAVAVTVVEPVPLVQR